LDIVLKTLHRPNFKYIICGDFNINYLTDNPNKSLLDYVLCSCNLVSIVDFPTRIQNTSTSVIDNIFIDYSREKSSNYISPLFNGLSDHDDQLLLIRNVDMPILPKTTQTCRKIDKLPILKFKLNLSLEIWDNIFGDKDVNIVFNSLLNTYLRLFFFLKSPKNRNNRRHCITVNIKMQCTLKMELYLPSKNDDGKLKKLLQSPT